VQRLGLELVSGADANMIFVRVADDVMDRLEQSGLLFYRMGPGMLRFVTSFRTTVDEVDEAIARIAAAL
jgi:threonine aldolase